MARIGVFIDGSRGRIPPAFREKIVALVKEYPEAAFCTEEEALTSPEGLERMKKRLEAGGIDRLVIIGESPKRYESSFQKWGHLIPLNPYLVAVANVEAQAFGFVEDEGEALERTKAAISKAMRLVSASRPIETQSIPLNPEALVLGGGIVGISIARSLAQAGIHVTLVEKGEQCGGRASELRTLYNRPEEVRNWIEEKVVAIKKNPRINLMTRSELRQVEGHLGQFKAKIRDHDGTETDLFPSAIVVATGYATQQDKTKDLYRHKRVVSLSEMEKLLTETTGPFLRWEGKSIERVTYLLDQVNEDLKIDSMNAIKQSLLFQEKFGGQVAILCRDVKVSADGMERLYRKAREKGALFFKYDEPPQVFLEEDLIRIDVKDTAAIHKDERWPVSIPSDLLIVGEAFVPNPETERLSQLLKIHIGDRGFMMEDNPQLLRIRSNRRGVFVAGGCRFPQELSESLIEARALVQEVVGLLSRGSYTFDLAVAEVDPKKCAVCYTCPRLCPHSAITIEKYAERNTYAPPGPTGETQWGAARVNPAACYGCGICVAECPAKAITFHHLNDEQIYAQMGLSL
jgi:heterodisulfide reductase subunit A